jgi:hypothetical protein
MKRFAVAALVLGAAAPAAAQYALSPPSPGVTQAPSDCAVRLAKIAEFQPLPAIAGPGECGAPDVVLLRGVLVPGQAKVAIKPPATLRCSMAEQVAGWIRNDVSEAVKRLHTTLRDVEELGSYECRSRNRVPGAGLSEHGRADALDIAGFGLGDGRFLALTDTQVDRQWREAVRGSACARFTTVLGPGADAYHAQHIHLDLAQRRGGYRMCQWDVREPGVQVAVVPPAPRPVSVIAKQTPASGVADPVMLPRARPPEAPAPVVVRARHHETLAARRVPNLKRLRFGRFGHVVRSSRLRGFGRL